MSNRLHIKRKVFADPISLTKQAEAEKNDYVNAMVADHFLNQPEGYMIFDDYSHDINYPISISDDKELFRHIYEFESNENSVDAIENAITNGNGVHIDGIHYSSEWMNSIAKVVDDEKVNQS